MLCNFLWSTHLYVKSYHFRLAGAISPSHVGNPRGEAPTTSFLRFREGIPCFPTVIVASSLSEIFVTRRIIVSNRLNSKCSMDMVRIRCDYAHL